MLTLKRKNLILSMLVVLLLVTGYLNYIYNQNTLDNRKKPGIVDKKENKPTVTVQDVANSDNNLDSGAGEGGISNAVNTSGTSGFFTEYRFERENTRKKEIEYIRDIIDNPNSETEMKNEAQAQLLEITANMERELNIEGLLKAKGFSDSIVLFNRDYVSIIVDKEELAPEEVAQILDVVKRESGKSADNIKIIPTRQ